MGKARTAPLKSITVPRLELSAAVVASSLDKMIRREIDLPLQDSVFWTDSTCVVNYIKNNDKGFHTFVANRIAVIHDVSLPSQWKYIPSYTNPADDASRGLTVDTLTETNRWINGPDFLWEQESTWPIQRNAVKELPEDDPEIKSEAQTLLTATDAGINSVNQLLKRFSSWSHLKKIVAWILRYRAKLRAVCVRRAKGPIAGSVEVEEIKPFSVDEFNNAEREVIKFIQEQSFKEEILSLEERDRKNGTENSMIGKKRKSPINKSNTIFMLDPMLVDGLLYVGGLLEQAAILDEAKHQITLPKKHHVVVLIVNHYHLKSGDPGLGHVLALIREKFWIFKGRSTIRRNLVNCFNCKKRQALLGEQKMTDLPPDRVTPGKPPFTFAGIDCFGPFTVRRGRSHVKRYGVLFTCMSIGAIHLEVAHSLDTDAFINAMR